MATDLITNIEEQIQAKLLTIDSTTPLPRGYTFFKDVTVVNIEDEAVAQSIGDYPTVSVYLEPEETTKDGNFQSYNNTLHFKLVCSVALKADSSGAGVPRFLINKEMNQILSDIKALFADDPSINCSCGNSWVKRSVRVYTTNGNAFRVGDINIFLDVQYFQLKDDPTVRCNR